MSNLQNIARQSCFDVFTVSPNHAFGYWHLKVIKTMRYLALRDNSKYWNVIFGGSFVFIENRFYIKSVNGWPTKT